uniref:Uncharacterized protein n=1 Tax=Timema monikensis TaxID=170555 RepID=A0A7R9HQA0_9NEOP|nr:unnamed protein product [Timema monikensis]
MTVWCARPQSNRGHRPTLSSKLPSTGILCASLCTSARTSTSSLTLCLSGMSWWYSLPAWRSTALQLRTDWTTTAASCGDVTTGSTARRTWAAIPRTYRPSAVISPASSS